MARASRIWGGYSPTPTYRLRLADGRRAFFKGTFSASNEFTKNALVAEERAYRELEPLLGRFMPQLYAVLRQADWHCLLLEDVGPKSVPPWTPARTRAVAHGLAAFHQSTLGATAPDWLPRPATYLVEENWAKTAQHSAGFTKIAHFAGDAAPQAQKWFEDISPTIEELLDRTILHEEPFAILHGDLRSDNLRLSGKQVYLFDWPFVTLGRPEWDLVAFAQSVWVEGGPLPERVLEWYREKAPLNTSAVEVALAFCLTYFTEQAWQSEIPGLPRLRRFQRQQLGTLILWIARHYSWPPPTWAQALLV